MALTISSKISVCPVSSERTFSSDSIRCQSIYQGLHIWDSKNGNVSPKLCLYKHESWINNGNHSHSCGFQKSPFLCLSNGTHHSEAPKGWYSDRTQEGHLNAEELFDSSPDTHSVLHERTFTSSSDGLSEAFRFVHNDAKFVNEKAHNDIILLSRGIARLDNRARQDFAILGSGFLKLDARAREDTEKIDNGVKERAARLKGLALNLKEKAESKLKSVADKHWSDGALEADLRRADFCFRRRAMEDAYMALEFVRNIHDMMVSRMHLTSSSQGSHSANEMLGLITLEKNGKAYDIFSGRLSADRITALQEVYWSMASALSEADGIDYTDPEELELLVSTLIDLDAMDGKRSVSLLAECSSSPDVSMRKALANALATAPSMWTLGNAGMGALQRLAEDSNPAVAAAASRAISELQRQWEVAEGDNLRFTLNQGTYTDEDSDSLK